MPRKLPDAAYGDQTRDSGVFEKEAYTVCVCVCVSVRLKNVSVLLMEGLFRHSVCNHNPSEHKKQTTDDDK